MVLVGAALWYLKREYPLYVHFISGEYSGETLICVSISDLEGGRCTFRTEALLSARQVCPGSPGLNVGVICDDGPQVLPRDSPEAVPSERGRLLSALSLMVACSFKGEPCMDLPFINAKSQWITEHRLHL